MTKRFGFTLAEVLITLGIIGVVAAMTIPTLISNTNGAQFKTAYKKALSVLNQAAVMNVALEDTDFSTIMPDDGATDDDADSRSLRYILTHRTMGTYTEDLYKDVTATPTGNKNSELGKITINSTNFHSIEFPDGTSFSYPVAAADGKTCKELSDACLGFIDANGKKGPNKEIECTEPKGEVMDKGATEADPENGKEASSAEACYVTNDTIGAGDIYPVYIHGQQIEPATDAARAVLYGNDKAPSGS